MQKFSVYLKEKFAVTQKVGSEETELAAFDSEQEAAAYQKETEDAAKKQKLEIKQMGDDGKEVKESTKIDFHKKFKVFKEEDINDFKVGDKVDSEEKQNGEVEAVGTRGTAAGKVKVRWAKDDVEVLCPKKLKLKKPNN